MVFSLACLGLLASIGGVFAASVDSSVIDSFFGIATYRTVSTETFVSPTDWKTCEAAPKTIRVKNESTAAVVARIKYTEEWVAADRTTILDPIDDTTNLRMAIIDRDDTEKWLLKSDGWYYYHRPLEPGESTSSFMKSVTLNCDANLSGESICATENGQTVCTSEDNPYGSATYTLRLTTSTIQENMAASEWDYAPVNNEAVLLNGATVTSWLGSMTEIERVDVLPENFPDDWRSHNDINNGGLRISTEASEKPVYAWTKEQYLSWGGDVDTSLYEDNVFYWFSEATSIYYNPDMSNYFVGGSDIRITGYDATAFDSSRVISYENAYSNSTFTGYDWLAGADLSNVESLKNSFTNANVHDVTPMAGWDVSNVRDFSGMFANNPNLTSVAALKDWNVSPDANITGMFAGCDNITDLSELTWYHN